ncbi:hypothetical protein CEW89_08620 [Celeribacter ethanolicus]|uniref:Uncharacterized protein n=1 Tax=Celeribacter ethanolicus TaxID=1758178 RepID=A0A291GC69_9RHOB|nr:MULTISPECIES: hypothetical protein [Celeribacter]ATG47632.1 hypothetical protein CEW89_08620 [Celeribacter ethanolicus]
MSRIFLVIAFMFFGLSTEIVQAWIVALTGINYEPSRDTGAATSAVFFVGLAIYSKIETNQKNS